MDSRRDNRQAAQPSDAGRDGLRPVVGQFDGSLGCNGGLLRDAVSVLLARRELDRLLVQLTTAPFSVAAYDGLRTTWPAPGAGRRPPAPGSARRPARRAADAL